MIPWAWPTDTAYAVFKRHGMLDDQQACYRGLLWASMAATGTADPRWRYLSDLYLGALGHHILRRNP